MIKRIQSILILIAMVIGAILFMAFFVFGISSIQKQNREYIQNKQDNFFNCMDRQNELEWCYEIFIFKQPNK